MFMVWGRAGIKIRSTATFTGVDIIQSWILIILAKVGGGHFLVTVVAGFDSALVPYGRHTERGLGERFPELLRRGCFLVCFPCVNFQALHGFETSITLVTLKSFTWFHRQLVGFQTSYHRRRFRGGLLCKKILSPFRISFEGWWAFSLQDRCGQGCLALLGLQGEGEVGADGDGDLERLAMTCQCLAKVQALSGQGGVSHAHSSHFLCLLLNF